MTPHAFIRRAGARHYRCIACLTRVLPRDRVTHLNEAIARAGIDGTTKQYEPLEDQ